MNLTLGRRRARPPDPPAEQHGAEEGRGSHVDGIIDDAGTIQRFASIDDLDLDTIQRVLDGNLMGTIHPVRAFLPG